MMVWGVAGTAALAGAPSPRAHAHRNAVGGVDDRILQQVADIGLENLRVGVDGEIGPEPLGQLEPVTVVGETGHPDPACAGGLGRETTVPATE